MGLYSDRRTPVRAACCGCIFVLLSQLKLALGRAGARYKHARWNPRGWKVNLQVRVLDLQYVFIDNVRLGRD